jgi:hypothetical protein
MKTAVEVSVTSWRKNAVAPGSERGRVLLMPGTGYNCDRPLLYWSAQALVEAGWRIDRMNVRNASDDLSTVIPVINDVIDEWVSGVREGSARSGRIRNDGACQSRAQDGRPTAGDTRMLLIGKSLTTLTYPHVARAHRLPFVLLTPVLHPADFDPGRQSIVIPAERPQSPLTGHGEPGPARRPAGRPADDAAGRSVDDSAGRPVDDSAGRSADDAAGRAADDAGYAQGHSTGTPTAYPGPAPLICAGTADPFYDRGLADMLTPHVHEYPDANHSIEVPGHWRRSLDYLKEITASVAQYAATL